MSETDARERTDGMEQPVEVTAVACAENHCGASTDDAVADETTTMLEDADASPGGSLERADQDTEDTQLQKQMRRAYRSKLLAFGVLPALAMILALTAGFFKWEESSGRNADLARMESVTTARNATIAMLSYQPDTVDKQLDAARDLLTGPFRSSYASLTNDVVIPGAKQKRISAVASVPAVASVTANPNHAVALVFVNQTVTVGADAPTDTASTVRVTMDKVGNRWLISGFDPV